MIFEEEDWKDGVNARDLENSLNVQIQHTDPLNNEVDIDNEMSTPNVSAKRKRKRKTAKKRRKEEENTCTFKTAHKIQDETICKNKEVVLISNSNNQKSGNTPVQIQGISSSCKQTKNTNTGNKELEKNRWKRSKLSKMLGQETISTQSGVLIKKDFANKTQDADYLKNAKKSNSRSDELRFTATTKLQSAQFRFINEQLYSRSSKDAKNLFASDSSAFTAYHCGFNQQVAKWPVNPLNMIINYLKKRPPRWIVGDFGCGDANLAASIKNKVHSFDLVALNERVTVADSSHVPLADGSLDVAVFCLSLMGTNYIDFIKEANRTLKARGLLKIAEVTSRFSSVRKFIMLMKKLGFDMERQDDKDTHFIMFDFRKVKSYQRDVVPPSGLLKPCVYKKR